MLPSINLQLTDFTAFNGDLGAEPQVSPDADTPVAGFAELLNQPVLIDDATAAVETGEALPQDGNILPSDLSESLLVAEEIADQSIKGDGVSHRAPQGELPEVRMVPPSESSNQMASPLNPEAQDLAVLIPARPEQGQRAGMHTGVASVAAELQSLVTKPTNSNTLSTGNPMTIDRVSESVGELRQAAALDKIENTIRPATALDPEAIKENSARISGSSPDPLGALIERWQGASSTQSSTTTPQAIAIASGLTLGTQAPLASLAPAPLPTPINVPLQDAAWGDALSDRVLFMTGQKIHNAEIRLNPAELGPITITVSVDDGVADVTFTAQHAAAREAIELAMPRLRELLSENGLQLGDASVAEQGVDQDSKGREAQEARDWNGEADDVLLNNEAEQIVPLRMPQGLLDTFA